MAGCVHCEHRVPVDIPDEIFSALLAQDLVIFAGSGISTEGPLIFGDTFYRQIASECGVTGPPWLPFSALMSRFCEQPNGRAKLLLKIRDRFEYVSNFPELRWQATRFHRELATIPYVSDIVTTNWDDFFETECGAASFLYPEDFVFWGVPGRKVFKIHGTVSNYGSLVATEQDYRECLERLRTGLVGSALKLALATKTILFVGYSILDEDFLQIYQFVKDELGEVLPHSYVVTIDRSSEARLRDLGLTPLFTDGTYFLELLKRRLVNERLMFPDTWIQLVHAFLARVRREHTRLHDVVDYRKKPDMIYATAYQDGLIHAFERMIARAGHGEYSDPCRVSSMIQTHVQRQAALRKERRYFDVAYLDGYINGLGLLVAAPSGRAMDLPLYYVFGSRTEPRSLNAYLRERRKAQGGHKAALRAAARVVAGFDGDLDQISLHHLPFVGSG